MNDSFSHVFDNDRAYCTQALKWTRPSPSRALFMEYIRDRRAAERAPIPIMALNNAPELANAAPPLADQPDAAAGPPAPLVVRRAGWDTALSVLDDLGWDRAAGRLRALARVLSFYNVISLLIVLLMAPSITGALFAVVASAVAAAFFGIMEAFVSTLISSAGAQGVSFGAKLLALPQAEYCKNLFWMTFATIQSVADLGRADEATAYYNYYYFYIM